MGNKRVVITGIGPVASPGIGKKIFWNGILKKRTNVERTKVRLDGEIWDEFYVHTIKGFNIKKFGLNEDILAFIEDWKESPLDMDLQYLLAAIKLALDDSGIDFIGDDRPTIGMVVSNENPGVEDFCNKILEEAFNKINKGKNINKKTFYNDIYYKIVKLGYEMQTFMPLFHITKVFNIHKYSLFINNACASGLYGLEAASDMIKLGKVPIAIIAAGDHANIYKHLWFKMINMYQDDGKIKPFSRSTKGLVMGEGAAALVLEDYNHARKRNAPIYAEYLGGGFRLEGWQITRPKLGSFFYHEAIKDAMTNSRVTPQKIDLIAAHGFGTIAGDFYEAKAIEDIFGSRVPVTTFKPYVGHNLGGSALLETVILLLALHHDFIPPIMNTANVDPRIKVNLVFKKKKIPLTHVMKICAAFAGYNSAAIFKKLL